MRAILVSTVVVLMLARPAAATTGNELKAWMNEGEAVEAARPGAKLLKAGQYMGYVAGVGEALDGLAWCSRPGVTLGQTMDVVSKYLRDNPEKLHEPAGLLVLNALGNAFPCKK
jgi:Ssp1 endopeptidase immunity protein Rap1a